MRRKPPHRHTVSGHTREGKPVKSYQRGKGTNPRDRRRRRTVRESIPIVTARDFVKKAVENYGGYSMTDFDSDETVFLPKGRVKEVRHILKEKGFTIYPRYVEEDPEEFKEYEKWCSEFIPPMLPERSRLSDPVTGEDIESLEGEVDVFGHKWVIKRTGLPIKTPDPEKLKNWRKIHIHAPARKKLGWYGRGWDYPMDFRESMK